MNQPRLRIKSDAPPIVKRTRRRNISAAHALLTCGMLAVSLTSCSQFMIHHQNEDLYEPMTPATEEPKKAEQPQQTSEAVNAENLPDIQARAFTVSTVRHTRTAAVYLFDTTEGELPSPGRIVLLRGDEGRVMAFRVMKVYPDKKQFAGRKVRVYQNHAELKPGETYQAMEKIADVQPVEPTKDDRSELTELEGGKPSTGEGTQMPSPEEIDKELGKILDYDPELDAESSPPPTGAVDSTNEKGVVEEFTPAGPAENEVEESGISIEEITPIEPNPRSLTGTFGYLRNGDGSSFPAGGARFYSRMKKMLFLNKPIIQDELGFEIGGFIYKAILTENDVYTVFPIISTFRYTIHLTEDFSVFTYGGLMKNIAVPATSAASTDTQQVLSALLPAIGAGMLFRIGPSWEARLDLGYDMLGLGLVIGF